MKVLEVLKSNKLTSFQDFGRFGYEDFGVTNSGASDEFMYNISNLLLENSLDETSIEIYMGGLELKVLNECYLSLSGADMQVKINDRLLRSICRFRAKKGDIITFGYSKKGSISYLSIKGGFKTKKYLNSTSVSFRDGFGSNFCKGFIIEAKKQIYEKRAIFLNESEYLDYLDDYLLLRYIPTYQYKLFNLDLFDRLEFFVSDRYNKMGFQLTGSKIFPKDSSLISEPIAFGSIQITNEGEPIVLLKERQTIGGYPKIGSVIPTDCFKLSQTKKNFKIRFKKITIDEAKRVENNRKIKLKILSKLIKVYN